LDFKISYLKNANKLYRYDNISLDWVSSISVLFTLTITKTLLINNQII